MMIADKVSRQCRFEQRGSRVEAQALCEAFMAEHKVGTLKEIGASCLEVVDAGFVLLMVRFPPDEGAANGKATNGKTANNLSQKSKNGAK
jgi:hypothetical protein